jgi:hypothetical protein
MNSFLLYLADMLPEDKRWLIFDKITIQTRHQIYSDLLRFEESILKAMRTKYGEASEQFIYFLRIKNTIIQAAEQQYIIENQKEEILQLREINKMMFEQNAKQAVRLNRYETIEEMTIEQTLEAYVKKTQQILKDRQITDKKEAATNGGL